MDLATSVWPQIWSLSTPHGIFVAHAPRNDDWRRGIATAKALLALRFLRHAVEAVLHLLHLLAQIVDVVVRCGLRRLFGFAEHRGALWHERLEHREGLLE